MPVRPTTAAPALTLALGLVLGDVSNDVAAQAATSATTPSATTATGPHAAGPYAIAIREGYAALAANDAMTAQLAFQRATAAEPTKSEGVYLLGVTMLRNGSYDAALESFRRAITLAASANDALGEGRARVALAHAVSSPPPGAMNPPSAGEAQGVWTALIEFADTHPDILDPAIPREERAARDRVAESSVAMAPVRTRIANREREAQRSGHPRH